MLLIHIYLGTIHILNHCVMRHPVLSLDSPLSSQCVRLAEAAASKARESARVSECAFSAVRATVRRGAAVFADQQGERPLRLISLWICDESNHSSVQLPSS